MFSDNAALSTEPAIELRRARVIRPITAEALAVSDGIEPLAFTIAERAEDRRLVLTPAGELDIVSAPLLEQHAGQAVERGEHDALLLDLSGLSFIDSTGLRAIVEIGDICKKRGRDFSLAPGPPAVQRLFEVTGLDEVLPFVGRDSGSA
jgi:anti-anti-sigma factor